MDELLSEEEVTKIANRFYMWVDHNYGYVELVIRQSYAVKFAEEVQRALIAKLEKTEEEE